MRSGRASEWFILIVSMAIITAFAYGWSESSRQLMVMQAKAEALIEAGLARLEDEEQDPVRVVSARPEPERWYEAAEWDACGMGRMAR